MGMEELSIDEMDEQIEKTDREITLEEKRKILKQYQNKYGIQDGIKKFLDKQGGDKQKGNTGGSGVDWNAIKFKL
jgi:hypothetical protein